MKLPNSVLDVTSGAVFVCHSDASGLHGAIVKNTGGRPNVLAQAESRAIDFTDALLEVTAGLKAEGQRVPKRAYLSTPSVVTGLLELPVNPSKPRPAQQMQELIRWELEAQIALGNDLWAIGAILSARGYITERDRETIGAGIERRIVGGQEEDQTLRFGEIAVRDGLATQRQLEECLVLQERLLLVDDEILCGWRPQTVMELDGAERHIWYACGIGRSLRSRWAAAFRNNGIRLERLYPALGAAFAAIDFSSNPEADRLLIEVQQEQIACLRGNEDFITGLRVERKSPDPVAVAAGMIRELQRQGTEALFVAGADARFAGLLSEQLGEPVQVLGGGGGGDEAEAGNAANPLLGIAMHVLKLGSQSHQVTLAATDPPAPVWKNKDFWRIAAAVAVVAAIGLFEIKSQIELADKEKELLRLDTSFSDELEHNKLLRSVAAKARAVQRAHEAQAMSLAGAEAELQMFRTVLFARQELAPNLLRAIRDAINAEVIIDAIIETGQASKIFDVTAWSLSDTAAQLFISKLDKTMRSLGLAVTGASVRRGRSRFDLEGYDVELRLITRALPDALEGAEGAAVEVGRAAGRGAK